MSNSGFPMPKSVFRGENSDGSSFHVEEWNYTDWADLQIIPSIFMFLFLLAIASVAAPVLTLLLLSFVGVEARLRYLFTALLSAYVLYDFSHGWICMIGSGFFFSPKNLSYIMNANLISMVISLFMLFFHRTLNMYVFEPVRQYTEKEYSALTYEIQKGVHEKVQEKLVMVTYVIIFLSVLTFFIGTQIDAYCNGWVKLAEYSVNQ